MCRGTVCSDVFRKAICSYGQAEDCSSGDGAQRSGQATYQNRLTNIWKHDLRFLILLVPLTLGKLPCWRVNLAPSSQEPKRLRGRAEAGLFERKPELVSIVCNAGG